MRMSAAIIILILFCSCFILTVISQHATAYVSKEKAMAPILDKSVIPGFKLKYCEGYEADTNWKGRHVPVPDNVARKFKSKKFTKIEEGWEGPGQSLLRIFRWCFEFPEDAALYTDTSLPVGSVPFPGWSKSVDIGDKTCWWGYDCVFFTKGKTLVKINLSADTNSMPKGKQEALVRRVAEYIVKKL